MPTELQASVNSPERFGNQTGATSPRERGEGSSGENATDGSRSPGVRQTSARTAMNIVKEGGKMIIDHAGGSSLSTAGVTGMLQVDVVQAKDLPARDSNGTSDPYITVRLNKQKAKTSVRACTLTPVWEHRMIFRVRSTNEKIVIKVFDHDNLSWSDDFLGTAEVDVEEFLDGELHNKWVKLVAIESGEVRLRVKYFHGVVTAPKGGWEVEERIDAEEAANFEKSSWALSGRAVLRVMRSLDLLVESAHGFKPQTQPVSSILLAELTLRRGLLLTMNHMTTVYKPHDCEHVSKLWHCAPGPSTWRRCCPARWWRVRVYWL